MIVMPLNAMVKSGSAGVATAVLTPNRTQLLESMSMDDSVLPQSAFSVSGRTYTLYEIVNSVNGKRYYGITSRPMMRRFREHLSDARCMKGKMPLHKAIRKYGEAAFSVSVMTVTEDWAALCKAEIEMIAAAPVGSLYNVTTGGEGILGVDRAYQTGDNSWARSPAGRAWFASHVSHLSLPAHAERMRSDNPAKRPGVMDCIKGENNPAKRPEVRAKIRANNPLRDPVRRAEILAKRSASLKGRAAPWMIGDKNIRRCPEERARISGAGNPNAKAAIINGTYYPTLQHAADAMGVAQATTIASRIKRGMDGYAFAERKPKD